MQDVIVIGGGVIGLAIARELAGRKSVLLLDRGPTGQGTSRAAAGMLSPLSEADDQGPFFQLSRASHAMYDAFIRDLEDETKLDCAYSSEGLLAGIDRRLGCRSLLPLRMAEEGRFRRRACFSGLGS